ncbi:hypothetical protein KSP40_PGU009265 [Platanthera guangdongensis]|uniref:Uncharacterized protein n=1 Tax=Platanthera guangdongensis TaxID=2320717 RepID=A0ABR2LWD8_9ASPA
MTGDFSFPIPPAAEESYAADKVFRHGRLLPFNVSLPTAPENSVETGKLCQTTPLNNLRRSESLDGNTRQNRSDAPSADYERLRRASSDPRPMPATGTSSKWPLFLLGSVRFPAEMEMRDIRNRQRRRCQAPAAAPTMSRWGILRALSCKAAENTAMTPVRATS